MAQLQHADHHAIQPAAFACGSTRKVMCTFIAYQFYRYSYTPSFGLILMTVFDLLVIILIWHEWKLLRRHLPTP